MTKNKIIEKEVKFPDPLASDEEKMSEAYGLAFSRAIEAEWFQRNDGSVCNYFDKRDKYHLLRMYSRGEQDTKIYKDLLSTGDESYTNYDWRPIQIVSKFVKLIVNQMSERLFDIRAEATDKFSTDLKDNYRKNLENLIIAKPIMQTAKESLGVDVFPPNYSEYPESREEIDLFMQLKYKPAIEIATEEALKYTLSLNEYQEVKTRVVEDITVLGIGGVKHSTDPSKGITVEYVDPANTIYSYPRNRNFKDVYYYGEVRRITINELKRMSNNKFTNDELREIAESSGEWSRYQGESNEFPNYRNEDLSNFMIDIMFFNFKSTNTITYKKKKFNNGGFKMTKKESTFNKKDKNYDGYDVEKKVIDVWYEGVLLLGCGKIFNYKLCENMIRPEGHLNITSPNYIFYAPEIYQNRTKSLVERIIPYVDQMQQIHIKMQQLIAKARPSGIYIDVAGLNEIDLGDGNFLSPLEAIKIYDETGNVIGTSLQEDGTYNQGKVPIQELNNGIVQGIDRLMMAYNHYLNLLRDAIGVPQGADASAPHPDTLVGVQQAVALNSNTATRHILDASLNISERLGKALALRLKDIFLYSNLKQVYINAVGQINVSLIESMKNFHLHDMGIIIELKPDDEEKQFLEQNIQRALADQSITLDDAIDIRTIGNVKLANELLKTRRIRREREKHERAKELAKINSDAQIQATQIATQSKQQEIALKSQADLELVRAKAEADRMRIEAEVQAKSKLMEQEFGYNMTIKGIETENLIMSNKMKEDRKDERQDRNNTQASKMIEQRHYNQPAMNFEEQTPVPNMGLSFESSEDNISGGVELSELEPQ